MNTRLVKSAALALTFILAVASGPAWGVPAIDPF
jgi:hypothetical protein